MRAKVENYIKIWEGRCYSEGIPDEVPDRLDQLNRVPSYKRIVKAILTNDLGKIAKLKKSKYYSIFKAIEIGERDSLKKN